MNVLAENTKALNPRGATAPNPWVVGTILTVFLGYFAAQRDFGADGYFIPMKGLLVAALGLAPGLAYFNRVRSGRKQVEPLPYIPLLGLIYTIYYGLPVLLRDRVTFMSLAPNEIAISEALDMAILGWVVLLIGYYYAGPRLFALHADRPLKVSWDEGRARSLATFLIVTGAAATVISETVPIPSYLVQVLRMLRLMLQLGLGICIMIDLKGGATRGWRIALWGFILPAFMLLQLRSGAIGVVVRPLVFVLFLIWACRFRLPWKSIALLVFLIVILRGAAAEFRTMLWRSTDIAESSAIERTSLYLGTAWSNVTSRPGETIEEAGDLIGSRTAQLALFAYSMHQSPEAIPYWEGQTYRTLASSFIPRFIWRDKPSKNVGQRFGHRYAIIHPDDTETAINLPQLVEFFVNFGPLGVLFGMLGMGLLYSFVCMKLNHANAGEGTTIIGAMIFSELVNIESDFSLVFGGLIQTAVILYFVMKFCSPHEKRSSSNLRALDPATLDSTQ